MYQFHDASKNGGLRLHTHKKIVHGFCKHGSPLGKKVAVFFPQFFNPLNRKRTGGEGLHPTLLLHRKKGCLTDAFFLFLTTRIFAFVMCLIMGQTLPPLITDVHFFES